MLCPSSASAKYEVTRYNQYNGLPYSHVTKITQDDMGMIWIGTWNGLIRYDGYHFVSFKSQQGDGNNIATDRVRDVIPDREVFKDKSMVKGNLYVIFEDDIFLFDIHRYKFSPVDKAVESQVRKVREQNLQTHLSPCNRSFGDVTIPNVTHEFTDRQGILWLRTDNGIVKVTNYCQPWQKIDGVSDNIVRMMYADRAGRIWISTKDDERLSVYTPSMRLIGYLGNDGRLHKEPVAFHNVYSMLQDRSGTIWIGSKPDGLFRVKESNGAFSIERISLGTDGGSNSIYDFAEDRQGRLWIATLGGGLQMISNPQAQQSQLSVYNQSHGLKGYPGSAQKVRKVMITDRGIIILSTTNGLVTASGVDAFPAKPLTWHQHCREANRKESLSSSATMSAILTNSGQLVVATETGGINVLPDINKINDGTLSFKHYTERNGLANDGTLAIMPLSDNEILVQQINAISILNIKTGICRNYMSGFWGEPLRFSDAAPLLVVDGRLLVSLETGAISVPLKKLSEPKTKPKIALTMIDCMGAEPDYSVNSHDTIRLSSHQRDFTLSFAALDYIDNHNIMYSTRMDDADEWSAPSHNTDLTINNLRAGEHRLEIRSTNAYGQWTDNTRIITIIVEPTFFEAWYGMLTLLLIISAIIAGITYTILYIRNINARRRETLDAYLRLLEQRSKAELQAVIKQNDSPTDSADTNADGYQPVIHNGTEEVSIIAPRLSDDDECFLRKLTEFVEQNMSNSDITIIDMAQATATSRSGLNRRMHQLVGVTPADFLKEARLKRASQLLLQTDKPISEIAYQCGFSDPKYFGKVFKSSLGKAPKEYRNTPK